MIQMHYNDKVIDVTDTEFEREMGTMTQLKSLTFQDNDVDIFSYFSEKKDEKQQIVKLTGLPVSEEMQDILQRLENKKYVTVDEINSTQEMKVARSNIDYSRPTIQLDNRLEIQVNVLNQLNNFGSVTIDGNGIVLYNGDVTKGSRLDIVIGLPASGKSSAIVDRLSQEFNSKVIDNDEAKKMIPEYNNGWGSGVVHKESQVISDRAFKHSLSNKENIVLPKIGSNADKLLKHYIEPAKEAGYTVNIHFVDLDRNKALGRMLNRFIEDGRFLDPNLIEKYAPLNQENHVQQSYEQLKENPLISGFSMWNNDVSRGERPILIEHENLTGNYIDNSRKGDDEYGMESEYERGREGEVVDGGTGRGSGRKERYSDTVGEETQGRDGEAFGNRPNENISSNLRDGVDIRGTGQDERGGVGVTLQLDEKIEQFRPLIPSQNLDNISKIADVLRIIKEENLSDLKKDLTREQVEFYAKGATREGITAEVREFADSMKTQIEQLEELQNRREVIKSFNEFVGANYGASEHLQESFASALSSNDFTTMSSLVHSAIDVIGAEDSDYLTEELQETANNLKSQIGRLYKANELTQHETLNNSKEPFVGSFITKDEVEMYVAVIPDAEHNTVTVSTYEDTRESRKPRDEYQPIKYVETEVKFKSEKALADALGNSDIFEFMQTEEFKSATNADKISELFAGTFNLFYHLYSPEETQEFLADVRQDARVAIRELETKQNTLVVYNLNGERQQEIGFDDLSVIADVIENLSVQSEGQKYEVLQNNEVVDRGIISGEFPDIIAKVFRTEHGDISLDIPKSNEELAKSMASILYHKEEDLSDMNFDDIYADILLQLEDAKGNPDILKNLIDRLDNVQDNLSEVDVKVSLAAAVRLEELHNEKHSVEQGMQNNNPLKTAEESIEGNYNMIDGIINNIPNETEEKDERKSNLRMRVDSYSEKSHEIAESLKEERTEQVTKKKDAIDI